MAAARLTVQRHRSDPLLTSTRVDLDLAADDVAAARASVERWVPDGTDLVEVVRRGLRHAVLLAATGDDRAASDQLSETLTTAQAEELIGPFLDCPAAMDLLAALERTPPSAFVQRILAANRAARRRTVRSHLVAPLTEREILVLDLLPTRLTNADIGRRLFVSVNTVKTHLRSIYAKLGVGDRNAAIERAEELGLL